MIDAVRNAAQTATNAPAAGADAPGEGFGDLIGQLQTAAGASRDGEPPARAPAARDAGTDRRGLERLLQRRSTTARADVQPEAAGIESLQVEIPRGRADQQTSGAAPHPATGANGRSKAWEDDSTPRSSAPAEAGAGVPDPTQAAVVPAMTISGANPPVSPPATLAEARSDSVRRDQAARAAIGRIGMPAATAPLAASSSGAPTASPKAASGADVDKAASSADVETAASGADVETAGRPARESDDTTAPLGTVAEGARLATVTAAEVTAGATSAPPGKATTAANSGLRVAPAAVASETFAAARGGSDRNSSAGAAAADPAVVFAAPGKAPGVAPAPGAAPAPGVAHAPAARGSSATGPIAPPASAAAAVFAARPEDSDTGSQNVRGGAPDAPAGGRAADRRAPVGDATESPVAAGAAAMLAAVGDAEHATAGGRGTRTGADEAEAGLHAATASAAAAGAAWTPQAAATAGAMEPGHTDIADAADIRHELPARLESADFPGQFADTVESLALQGIDQAELVVNPPELGPIRISLSMTNDTLSIAFASEHVETRQAIERSLPALQAALEEHGIELGDTHLGAGFDPRGGDGALSQRQSPDFTAAAGLPSARRDDTTGGDAQTNGARQPHTSPRTPRLLDLFA